MNHQVYFKNIHPEVNHLIPKMTQLSPLTRFGFAQAVKGRLYIWNFILLIERLKNRLTKTLLNK